MSWIQPNEARLDLWGKCRPEAQKKIRVLACQLPIWPKRGKKIGGTGLAFYPVTTWVGINTTIFQGQLPKQANRCKTKPQRSGSRPHSSVEYWKTPWWFGEGNLEGDQNSQGLLNRYQLRQGPFSKIFHFWMEVVEYENGICWMGGKNGLIFGYNIVKGPVPCPRFPGLQCFNLLGIDHEKLTYTYHKGKKV